MKKIPPNNGAILNIAHIIRHVMSSATKLEIAAFYLMTWEAVYTCITLKTWDTSNLPLPSKQTMTWQMPSSMEKYSPNAQRL
jgi:lysophospholipid acyltransferase (LPLAT)-like uncharacterized protein